MHPLSLTRLIDEQLGAARTAGNGRSARTVHGGHDHALRQTLIALTAGSELAEHRSPGEATLQVLHGRVRLTTATDSREAVAGDHLVVPAERHGLAAVDDSAVLLTVVVNGATGRIDQVRCAGHVPDVEVCGPDRVELIRLGRATGPRRSGAGR